MEQQQQTLHQVRTKICSTCMSYNKVMDTCQQIEKIIVIYTKKMTNRCPLNKWPQ